MAKDMDWSNVEADGQRMEDEAEAAAFDQRERSDVANRLAMVDELTAVIDKFKGLGITKEQIQADFDGLISIL
jgi:hypothetical protein